MTTTKTFTLRTGFTKTSPVAVKLGDAVRAFSQQVGNLRINVYTGRRESWSAPTAVVQVRVGEGRNAKYEYFSNGVSTLASATATKKFKLPLAWKRGSMKWKSFTGVCFIDRTFENGNTRVRFYYDKDSRAVYVGIRNGIGSAARYTYFVVSSRFTESYNVLGTIRL